MFKFFKQSNSKKKIKETEAKYSSYIEQLSKIDFYSMEHNYNKISLFFTTVKSLHSYLEYYVKYDTSKPLHVLPVETDIKEDIFIDDFIDGEDELFLECIGMCKKLRLDDLTHGEDVYDSTRYNILRITRGTVYDVETSIKNMLN